MKRHLLSAVLVGLVLAAASQGQAPPVEKPAGETPAGHAYALLLSGVCLDFAQADAQRQILEKAWKTLVDAGSLEAGRVVSLCGGFAENSSGPATAETLGGAFEKLCATLGPSDTFLFYYRGQANVVGEVLRINLEGPDVTHEDLAGMLSGVKCARMIIILDCPGAGLAVKALSSAGRIIICGARGDQPYSTLFSEYFLPALCDASNDYDSDGSVSLLEAYRRAVVDVDAAYEKAHLLKTESALLEDDGDAVPTHRPWEQDEEGYDGAVAAKTFLLDLEKN